MRLRHIEVLYSIFRTGSISAAAAALSITQPAVSKLLKHAEQQLGFTLFRRVHGRIQPTDEALALLADVEKVFAALDRTRDSARILRERLDARLRVACLPSLGFGVMPGAVERFRALRPHTAIEVAARHTPEMISALLAREFDVGLGFGPEQPEDDVVDLDASLLAVGHLVYIDHPSRMPPGAAGPMPLGAINGRRLIGLTSSHHLGTVLQQALQRHGIVDAPGIQVQTYYFARALVAADIGCAVVDEFTAYAQAGEVVVRPIEPPVRYGVYAYTSARHPPSPRTLEFLDCVRAACSAPASAPAPMAVAAVRTPPAPRKRMPRSGRAAGPPR